jgi:hypothetical protein
MPVSPDNIQPYEGNDPYLFVSYSRKDADAIQPILQGLAGRGVRLWWDLGLQAGEEYGARLEQLVDGSAGLVVFLSVNSTKQKKSQNWVLSETKHAAEAGKEIVPVMLEDFALPLEWKALVEHRQIVAASQTGREGAVQGIVSRAQALGCIEAEEVPQPEKGKSIREKKRGKRPSKDAWLQPCMNAIDQLQKILAVLFDSQGEEPESDALWNTEFDYADETDEPPDHAIRLPLKVDSDEHYSRCGELIEAANDLLDPALPISERLTICLSLTEKIPASRDDKLDLALALCHLYHLTALVRIHADARQAPGAETANRLNRASALMTGSGSEAHGTAVYELLQLAHVQLDIARLELALMAGLPDSKSLKLARSKGILAYSTDWRSRIDASAKLEREFWCFTWSGQQSQGVVANAFRSQWTLGDWVACCHRDLMRPGIFHASPLHPITQAPGMQHRGAELALKVRSQIGWGLNSQDLSATGQLLLRCFRPLPDALGRYPEHAFEWKNGRWLVDVGREAAIDSPAFEACIQSQDCCILLAALLALHRRNEIRFGFTDLKFDRDALVRRFGRELALQGSVRDQRWLPADWMFDAGVLLFLWVETRRAIVEDLPYAADLLSLAVACDPDRTSVASARSTQWFHGSSEKRIAEILAAPQSLTLQRANWLPPQCYHEQPDRISADVRTLFAK